MLRYALGRLGQKLRGERANGRAKTLTSADSGELGKHFLRGAAEAILK
jgi:hypothetical protein